jgi:hypothetical protein
MHRLPGNPATAGHVHHRRPVVKDHQHGPVALLHQPQLHQHGVGLLRSRPPKAHSEKGGTSRSTGDCHAPTGATVAQDPEPRPETVSQQPEPQRKA